MHFTGDGLPDALGRSAINDGATPKHGDLHVTLVAETCALRAEAVPTDKHSNTVEFPFSFCFPFAPACDCDRALERACSGVVLDRRTVSSPRKGIYETHDSGINRQIHRNSPLLKQKRPYD